MTPEMVAAAGALLQEYQEAIGIDLSFQGFADELSSLPGDYAPPHGRLLLAYAIETLAGCVAMRPFAPNICEMKRLYVKPLFRATGVGRRLAERVIAEARAAGYRHMYLDTIPAMEGAIRLYESLGFRDIPPYRHNPVMGTRFLALEL